MNSRYNYGRRPSNGGTESMGAAVTITVMTIIFAVIFYLNIKSDVSAAHEQIEELRNRVDSLEMSIDIIKAKPVQIEIPKKEEPKPTFRRRTDRDTSKRVPEKPKEISQTKAIAPPTIQDTAR